MKVLMQAPMDYTGGGVGTHWRNIIKQLKTKVDFVILSCDTKEKKTFEEEGIKIYQIPYNLKILNSFWLNPQSKKYINEIIEKERIDIIHIQLPIYSACFNLLNLKKDIPILFTIHYPLNVNAGANGFLYNNIIKYITKKVANKSNRVIALSENYKKILNSFGVDSHKIKIIGNGIDNTFFKPGSSEIKDKLNCKKAILYFGRFHYQKNPLLLIKAFNQINRKDTKLVMIGEGPELKKLKKLANENVIFTGYLDNQKLLEYMQASDIAVFPSRAESWGLTIAEAMSVGLPVIASNTGEIPNFLADGRGLILENNSEHELKNKILKLLDDPELAKDMGKRSRKYIQRHSWENISNELLKVYEEVVKK